MENSIDLKLSAIIYNPTDLFDPILILCCDLLHNYNIKSHLRESNMIHRKNELIILLCLLSTTSYIFYKAFHVLLTKQISFVSDFFDSNTQYMTELDKLQNLEQRAYLLNSVILNWGDRFLYMIFVVLIGCVLICFLVSREQPVEVAIGAISLSSYVKYSFGIGIALLGCMCILLTVSAMQQKNVISNILLHKVNNQRLNIPELGLLTDPKIDFRNTIVWGLVIISVIICFRARRVFQEFKVSIEGKIPLTFKCYGIFLVGVQLLILLVIIVSAML